MKKIVTGMAIIGISALLALSALEGAPEPYDSTVTGKGDPTYDVKAVQDAVNQGGTVLLKGAFDFGADGRVNIANDVKIVGETDSQGKPLTKILGGKWTFYSPLPSPQLPPEAPGPKVTIQGIHFDGAVWTPIHLAYTSGAEISGNKITNVVPYGIPSHENPYKWKGLEGWETMWIQQGAVLATTYTAGDKYLPGAVTGLFIFENNEVDLESDKPQVTLGQGVYFKWTTGATIQIRGNVFKNVSRNSIESLNNYLDQEGRGTVIIEKNKVITPPVGFPLPSPSTPNGIIAGWFPDVAAGADPTRNSKIVVMDNYVEVRGDTSMGIALLSDQAVVACNDIVMGGGSKATGIVQMGSDGLIGNNKITGSGLCALHALPYGALVASRNKFVLNNISQFKASIADVILKGNNNVLLGKSCTVNDQAKGNQILRND